MYISVYPSICLSIYLSIHPTIYLVVVLLVSDTENVSVGLSAAVDRVHDVPEADRLAAHQQ